MADTPPKKSDLGVRTLSAVVMLAVSGTALWLGGWWWTVFVAAVALGVLWEWWGLVRGFPSCHFMRLLWLLVGLVYVGVASSTLVFLRNETGAGMLMISIVILPVVATDIGAYFAGRAIGGPKIAPSISPSKTWSGLIGGMVAAAIVLYFTTSLSGGDDGPVSGAVFIGAVVAIVAQIGDFFESWIKRRAGVKDSGNLIPGHGGLFDRLDGLLAVCFVIGLVIVTAMPTSTTYRSRKAAVENLLVTVENATPD